jgi:molecular chaperone GrpE
MTKKPEHHEQQIAELTGDLQRQRADFENYRKRVDAEKQAARAAGKIGVIFQLLPVLDDIELAVGHMPEELKSNEWAHGVKSLPGKLEKNLEAIGVSKIDARVGTPFNPEQHEAVTMEDGDGEREVVAEELRAGYKMGNDVIRPAMVRVAKR